MLSSRLPLAVCLAWAFSSLGIQSALANTIQLILKGKVVMRDGSPLPKAVEIQRNCDDYQGSAPGPATNRGGEYLWRMEVDTMAVRHCNLTAELTGYVSTSIDISNLNLYSDPNLPDIVLIPKGQADDADIQPFVAVKPPLAAAASWNRAMKALGSRNWPEAERQLRASVARAPRFAQGWNALAILCERQAKPAQAREAYSKAVQADPKLLAVYLPLARLQVDAKDWKGAADTSAALIRADPKQQYPGIYLPQAVAQFELKDFEGAQVSAAEAIRLDRKGEATRAEFVLARILEARGDLDGARQHFSRYLELEPKAIDASVIRAHLENLGKSGTGPELAMLAPGTLRAPVGEAWVPGGRKALALVAHMDNASSYADFFADYSRTIAREVSVGTASGIPAYRETLRAFMASVAELAPFGERKGDDTLIRLSLATAPERNRAGQILSLLGWQLLQREGEFRIQLGDQPVDALRQPVAAALGIDEIAMQEALESGKTFQFVVPSENARLIGGDAWGDLVRELPTLPGGLAAEFTTDVRLARAYAGLGAMGPDTAAAVLSAASLRALVTQDASPLALYGEAFAVANNGAVTPGGSEAEPAWRKIAGVSPRQAPAFFRALLAKDQGRAAAFYHALWLADAAHQRFFTKTVARAEKFYTWYINGGEFRNGVGQALPGWREEFFAKLPLGVDGSIAFPGGRRAWTTSSATDEGVLLSLKNLEALVPVAELEHARGAALDEASASLLAQHYEEWRGLFPYFEQLPGLASGEFQALAAFEDAAGDEPPVTQNLVLGQWDALIELVARGVRSGALDRTQSARAFRNACTGLASTDYSSKTLEVLREIAGGGDLNQAIPTRLLRLNGGQLENFRQVLQLQHVPELDEAAAKDPAELTIALSGQVYAASLDPGMLLVSEDAQLLRKHQFIAPTVPGKPRDLFAPSALNRSSKPPGSYLSGSFAGFAKIVAALAHKGQSASAIAQVAPTPPSTDSPSGTPLAVDAEDNNAESASQDPVFRASGRLVEVYATITDARGRYVDNLPASEFSIAEEDEPRPLTAFESQFSAVSCALLLDTTGSMQPALPALKNGAMRLIDTLRPGDSAAVYSFAASVNELQPFTSDRSPAKQAIVKTQAFGDTALYDALIRVSQDLSGRAGKKAMIVFSDGDDNSSTLTADAAILQAKAAGVPVFTIAEGEALKRPEFLRQLSNISKATGGEAFVIHNPGEIESVFEKVSADLTHGYLLTFQPAPTQSHEWRKIEVVLKDGRGRKIRAREGYFPE